MLPIALIAISAFYVQSMESQGGKGEYNTMVHKVLDLEKVNGLQVKGSHYLLMDRIIDSVALRVSEEFLMKKPSSPREALELIGRTDFTKDEIAGIFHMIDDVLTSNNFVHGVNFYTSSALEGAFLDAELKAMVRSAMGQGEDGASQATGKGSGEHENFIRENKEKLEHIMAHIDEKHHIANCEIMSFIYKSVLDVLGQPAYIVKAPGHSFVRWASGGEYLDWETTSANVYTDEQYIGHFNLTREAIDKGVYLASLKESEAYAIEYIYLGNLYVGLGRESSQAGNHDKALRHYNKAVELFSDATGANRRSPVAHNNMAMACFERSRLLEELDQHVSARESLNAALDNIEKAISLYPSDEFVRNRVLILSSIVADDIHA